MRALTVRQPWASAIIRGPKRVENRTKRPPRALIGEQLAIHAGLHRPTEATIDDIVRALDEHPDWLRDLPRGVVLGVVVVTSVIDDADAWRRYSPWVTGPWCWVLDDVVSLPEPVPCTGHQGVWDLPDDVEARVKEQLR